MAKVIACTSTVLAVLILLAYVISLPVFYGMFALGDIENWTCYATQDSAITQPWLGRLSPPDDYHDVSGNFYMLNLWGFSNFMAPFGIGFLFLFCWCLYGICCGSREGMSCS